MSTKRGDHRQVTLDRHQESLGIIGSLSGIIRSPLSIIGSPLGIIGSSSGILGSSSGKLWEEERSDSPASDEDSSFWELYRYRCNALGIIGDHLVSRKSNLCRSGQRSHLNFSDEVGQSEEEDVLAYTVSQLSISPENTIFHFLHLDVGEVGSFSPMHKFVNFVGRVSGAPCATVWSVSHPSAGQLQVTNSTVMFIMSRLSF